jgi:hypothetical protein
VLFVLQIPIRKGKKNAVEINCYPTNDSWRRSFAFVARADYWRRSARVYCRSLHWESTVRWWVYWLFLQKSLWPANFSKKWRPHATVLLLLAVLVSSRQLYHNSTFAARPRMPYARPGNFEKL